MPAILIPPPRVPLVDGNGQITQAWYAFFRSNLQATADSPGGGLEDANIDQWDAAYNWVTANGPSSSQWATAFSWGDHATVGYLTAEADPLFSASPAAGIGMGDLSDWDQAFTWGDHAAAGYLVAGTAAPVADQTASAVAPGAAYSQAEIVQLVTDLNATVTKLNSLMAALRAAGIMTP